MKQPKTLGSLEILPQHEKLIEDSAIAPEVAQARGYRSVEIQAEMKRLGFSQAQCKPGLLIPIWGVNGEIVSYQIRPDEPRIGKNGKPIKYETPAKSRMVLDAHPSIVKKLLDPTIPLIITEGIRKADSAISHGLVCIALLGVNGFRGKNEFGGKTFLNDFGYIALNGRLVYIGFDSDIMLKLEVHRAMSDLAAFLESKKANVAFIYLPPGENGKKVGLDDFLAAGHSTQELLALATPELRVFPSEKSTDATYAVTDSGIIWRKPHSDGTVDVRLTNFTARIVSECCEDDGVETQTCFELEASLNSRPSRFQLTACQFNSMNWPVEHLGAGAVMFPGFGSRDHTRTAIQLLSEDIPRSQVYTHTGWKEIDGRWLYLSGGGAIGAEGIREGVQVRLSDGLSNYRLPLPPEGEELYSAVHASLGILDLAPDSITIPLLSAIWRAALGTADFSLHLSGPTGAGKSELAALVQRHWGPGMDSRHLPGSWSSTANALEGMAFLVKDAVFTIDDFCPTGSSADVARYHREADRILRAQGNNSARQRMRSDATLKASKPPRGLILSTGEDVPKGQSLRCRMLVIDLPPDCIDFDLLSTCQRDAEDGSYSSTLSGFVKWLAGRYGTIRDSLRQRVIDLRQEASRSASHRRTPEIVANLMVGMETFLDFAVHAKALSEQQAKDLRTRAWKALGQVAMSQTEHQEASEPTHKFIELLQASVAAGRAHVVDVDESHPEVPQAWGWLPYNTVSGSHWRPGGEKIGWLDGDNLYLEPNVSYAVAERMARDTGDSLLLQPKTLHKRLKEKGYLLSTEETTRSTNTIRKQIHGSRHSVLHMKASSLLCTKPDQSDHCIAIEHENGQDRGQFRGLITGDSSEESDHENCPLAEELYEDPRVVVSLVSSGKDAERETVEI